MATVLITGSSTGLGLATAVALARARHDVYATMRNPDRSPELQTIAHQESLPITILRLDVDSDDSVMQAVQQVLAVGGGIDVLVNNAGILAFGAVEDLPLDVFRRTMETNYFGALRCIQAVLPSTRERRSGCIVNVTSIGGRITMGAHGCYTATKFALEALSEALAQEVKAFNIRVAIVEPGIMQTAIFAKMPEDPPPSHYPHEGRLRALHAAGLVSPMSPFVAGEAIRQIVESDSGQLRYPVGPDALPFLERRAAMTDEAWLNWNTPPDDDEWYAQLERDFGLDARPFRGVRSFARGV
jgi:NAD(P)-dependent dehydrogenase (short-subunit alcohol dehydrogenase family)